MLKNGLSISWYLTAHSDKIDLDWTKIGIFKSWLVIEKDSIFQIFAWKKHMQVHGLSMSICGKNCCPPSKLTLCANEWYEAKWDCCRNMYLPTELTSEKWCCLEASLRREGWITVHLCRKVRLKIMKWVRLSFIQADYKYYKILSSCSSQ